MRGQTSAMADHVDLDWELRQLQRQARLPQQSWERGALATVFGRAGVLAAPLGEVPLPQCLPQRAGQGFTPMRAAYVNEEDNLKKQDTTKEKPAVLIQNTGNFKKTDEEARQAALEDWLDLVYKAGKESTLFEAASGGGTSEVKSSLEDAMASKATGTLRRRAASLILFIDWCETNLHQPFPITEERVYSYAKHLEDSEAPATRASAFKEALNFANGMLGLKGVSQAVLSPRVRGCVYNSIKRKRITVKKEPWTKEDIIKLEEAVISKSGLELRITLQEQVFLGFILFLIHCRARFGDGARVKEEPYLDISGDQGFIEVSIVGGDTKTGKAANKVRRSMPIVGHAIGVTGQNWAGPWLAVRKRMGLDAGVDQTLMPRPLLDGSFVGETITTSEGGRWLRIVAQKIGISLENKGTHSCKATLLSWCAKAGVNHTSRRLLGGHAKPKDTSVLEYSRDALAGPLRDLGRVLDLVRSKRFQPEGGCARTRRRRSRRTRATSATARRSRRWTRRPAARARLPERGPARRRRSWSRSSSRGAWPARRGSRRASWRSATVGPWPTSALRALGRASRAVSASACCATASGTTIRRGTRARNSGWRRTSRRRRRIQKFVSPPTRRPTWTPRGPRSSRRGTGARALRWEPSLKKVCGRTPGLGPCITPLPIAAV